MPVLRINSVLLTDEAAEALVKICPFSAISYENGELTISAACKMCRLCVKNGPKGVITVDETSRPSVDKNAYRGVAVFAEQENGVIHGVTRELIGKARELAAVTKHPVYALLIGSGVSEAAEELRHWGVDRVYVCDRPELRDFRIGCYTNAFARFVEDVKPSAVLIGATNIGRALAPHIAARCRTGLTADCTALKMKENTDLVQIRPAFGGNIMAQIVTPDHRPQFCTVRYKVFSEPKRQAVPSGEIVRLGLGEALLRDPVTILNTEPKPHQTDLSEAQVVVAVGRGLKSPGDIEMAKEFADLIGAQLACTRPMVEAGWFDPRRQIGLSGRTVNAKLIITLGISGSVQFAAGMRASQCIIAVNTDPNAAIFNIAHYGVVGDLYQILPCLVQRLKEGRP